MTLKYPSSVLRSVLAGLLSLALLPVNATAAETGSGSGLADPLHEEILASIARRSDSRDYSTHLPALADFYSDNASPLLWVEDGRANERAREFVAVLRTARDDALDPDDYGTELLASQLDATGAKELAHLEVDLSFALLAYTRHLSAGRINPRRINPELAIDPVAPDPKAVLAGASKATSMRDYAARSFEPQTPRYARLRGALSRYRAIASAGGWPNTAAGPLLKAGATDAGRVRTLRERLQITGDIAADAHQGDVYDGALVEAVKNFQARHGLEIDGVIGDNTLAQLNLSAEQRVRQIELNMERRRWMEDDLGDLYIFVNLADQFLKVVERRGDREKTIHTARTVVGKTYHRTPVFSRPMTYIVINPSWNVPRSIAVDEILPKLRLDPGKLAEDNMRLVSAGRDVDPLSIDWQSVTKRSFAWQLQQRPGANNALGEVKFMFPNRFNVYIHDTPAKHLFARAQRTFSHGCVRVQHPFDLAEVLLGKQGIDRDRIESLRASGEERVVSLERPVPVHVSYLTAWVNKDGSVHFRRDVYERDQVLDAALRDSRPRPI